MNLYPILDNDAEIVLKIKEELQKRNKDNISRTRAYLEFYLIHPEIIWSFLASMVSRNGGYNMCDLEGDWFPKMLHPSLRHRLFLTYERANWLIFRDAYAQLLLYSYSTKKGRPLFHLLKFLDISEFMRREWEWFWQNHDKQRLMIALIINEQNVIQKPIIEHPVFKKRVFDTWLFIMEDYFHFSTVLFPTCEGELYGASVNGFKSVGKRINLGKRLANILFSKELYPQFLDFALKTEHTASRYDYERYFFIHKKRETPFLRSTFPIIQHHYHLQSDWFKEQRVINKWLNEDISHVHPIFLSDWFEKKQKQIHALISVKDLFNT